MVASSTAATYIATEFKEFKTDTLNSLSEVMEWSLKTQYDGNFNSTNRWSRLWDIGHITVSELKWYYRKGTNKPSAAYIKIKKAWPAVLLCLCTLTKELESL